MKYKYHSETKDETAWIESPDGGEVGDLMDITDELNKRLDEIQRYRNALSKIVAADESPQGTVFARIATMALREKTKYKWEKGKSNDDFEQCDKAVIVALSLAGQLRCKICEFEEGWGKPRCGDCGFIFDANAIGEARASQNSTPQ